MLHLIRIAIGFVLFFTIAHAAPPVKEASQSQLRSIQKLELIQKAQIQVRKVYDAGSLYILDTLIQDNQQEIYLTKDKKVLLTGSAIDVASGQQIIIPVDMSLLKGKEALTYGTGKNEYYVFTDPECPYCKKFESYYDQIKDKVKLYIFFYPLNFHENARDMSVYILSKQGNDARIKAMFDVSPTLEAYKNREIDDKQQAKLHAIVDEHMQIARNLNVSGTPSVYDSQGRKISWAQLLMRHGIDLK